MVARKIEMDDRELLRARPRGRWREGAVLLALIIVVSLAVLAAADTWMMIINDAQRCEVQFPKWLGCIVANHESLSGSLIAAGGALFAAWVAWHAIMDQIESDKELARDAVRPLAYVMVGDYEERLFVKVANNGTGPMIIKSIIVNNSPQPLIDAMPDLGDVNWTNFVEDSVNRSVPAGGEIVLVDLASDSNPNVSPRRFAEARDLVRDALGNITVRVVYTDIYNKNQPPRRAHTRLVPST
jgi:hypothetical protein